MHWPLIVSLRLWQVAQRLWYKHFDYCPINLVIMKAISWCPISHLELQLCIYPINSFFPKGGYKFKSIGIWQECCGFPFPLNVFTNEQRSSKLNNLDYKFTCNNTRIQAQNTYITKKTTKTQSIFWNLKSPKVIWGHIIWDYIPWQISQTPFTHELVWD